MIPSDDAAFLLGDGRRPRNGLGRPSHRKGLATGRPDYTDSALCVPVRAGEKVLGALWSSGPEDGRSFTAGDEKLLLVLASQAGVALERARLHEQETHRLKLEEELAVARRIQLTLLPSAPPTTDWLDLRRELQRRAPGWR